MDREAEMSAETEAKWREFEEQLAKKEQEEQASIDKGQAEEPDVMDEIITKIEDSIDNAMSVEQVDEPLKKENIETKANDEL